MVHPTTKTCGYFLLVLAIVLVGYSKRIGLTLYQYSIPIKTVFSDGGTNKNDDDAPPSPSSLRTPPPEPEPAPAELLVAVVSSSRSGAAWLLSQLQQLRHPHICAPVLTDVLDPTLATTVNPNLSSSSAVCSYAFVRDAIQTITVNSTTNETPVACLKDAADYDFTVDDPLVGENLPLLCRWIDTLQGDYSDDAILNVWINAYKDDGKHSELTLLPKSCSSCDQQQPVKVVKVSADWLPRWPEAPWNPPDLNLNVTVVSGGKIIYVRRSNLLARFQWHYDAVVDTAAATDDSWTVDTEDMLSEFTKMEHSDATGAAWVHDHASQVLTVDYEDCRDNLQTCLEQILEFLGVAAVSNLELASKHYSDSDVLLDHVVNVEEVKEALYANGYGDFVREMDQKYEEVWLLVYETDPLVVRTRQFPGVHSEQFTTTDEQQSKWDAAIVLLREMPPGRLVVIGDGNRDVSTNYLYKVLASFRSAFVQVNRDSPGAVVLSASPNCCVHALTHVAPGNLFTQDGSRSGRACNSIDPEECPWNGDEIALAWQTFMKDIAVERGSTSTHIYLDAGLIAGKAGDMLHVLETANIESGEDATAVLTDLMYHNPELILLDYEQRMFGRYRQGPTAPTISDCVLAEADAAVEGTAAMLKSLILQNPETIGCNVTESKTTNFPLWVDGIVLKPILEHIQRVADKTGKLAGVDMSFGPEVPYFIDEDGLWSIDQIRNRTSPGIIQWRLTPIEGTMKLGHTLLTKDENAPTRWPVLHKALQSGGFPFFGWYGDFKKCNYLNYEDSDSIPMMTNSATVGCDYAFPTPSYQQMFDASTDRYRYLFHEYATKYPLESKVRKVVWRGTLSENRPERLFESIRWRLCETVYQSQSDLFDVGLSKIPKHNHRAENNLTQVGGLKEFISPMENFQNFLAILDMDGNSWSSRFGSLLCYNSVIIKIEPRYVDYFHYDLKPWTHYVPVRDDLSDLFEHVAYVMDPKNADVMNDIIASANQWCAARLHPTQLAHDMVDVFESYVRRLDLADPTWADEWNKKKTYLSFASDLDVVQL
jgi:Glycosyl transferase family 90/Sulfotransferase domain